MKIRRLIKSIPLIVLLLFFLVPPFIRPAEGKTTSGFFVRMKPDEVIFSGLELHSGNDIANAAGTRIKASRMGRITAVGFSESYGNYIEIDHGLGFSTVYAHLASASVKEGQFVLRGKTIGLMGSTGRSTGPHLHFEVR